MNPPLLPLEREAMRCAADAIEQWLARNCDAAPARLFNVHLLRKAELCEIE